MSRAEGKLSRQVPFRQEVPAVSWGLEKPGRSAIQTLGPPTAGVTNTVQTSHTAYVALSQQLGLFIQKLGSQFNILDIGFKVSRYAPLSRERAPPNSSYSNQLKRKRKSPIPP